MRYKTSSALAAEALGRQSRQALQGLKPKLFGHWMSRLKPRPTNTLCDLVRTNPISLLNVDVGGNSAWRTPPDRVNPGNHYATSSMDSTWIVLLAVSTVPVTLTFFPSNWLAFCASSST